MVEDDAFRERHVHAAQEEARHLLEARVERPEELRLVVLGFEHQRAERRRECQRREAGDDDRDRDRDRELLVELPRDAAQERHRDEHRAEHQDDRDQRAGDFAHRFDGSLARRHLLGAHEALDVLQHHDGVVHDDADRQHHGEEREHVDGQPQHVEAGERADDRHRTASIGIRVARHDCRKMNTTASTRSAASRMVTSTSWIDAFTTMVVSKGTM
jgi:hypothetical protein